VVVLYIGGHYEWTGTLGGFAADNELEPDEISEIRSCLGSAGQFYGGGGAQPEYKLMLPWCGCDDRPL